MSVLFFLIAKFTKTLKTISKKDVPLFLFRGFLIVVDFSCFYIAVTHLPLGLTLFVFYAASVITSFLFGAVFLSEKMSKIKWWSLGLSVAGLFLMHKESFYGITFLPSLAALVSGLCFGLNTSTSKKLTDKYSSTQVNLVAYLISFILVCPLLFVSNEAINFNLSLITWVELLGFSLVGVGAFYLTIDGFKYLEAQKASIIMLSELIFVVIIGYFLYSEIPTINTIIGGTLILLALFLPNIKK